MEKSLLINYNNRDIEFHLHDTTQDRGEGLANILRGTTYPIIKNIDAEVIVDLGANVGAASVFFAMNYPNSQIFSFEPTLMNFSLLRRNMESFHNVKIFNKGAHASDRVEKIFLDNQKGGRNSIYQSWTKSKHYEKVELVNIANFLEIQNIKKIDILKIDTEGCEVPIIKTLSNYYESLSVIYLEYHSVSDKKELLRLLENTHMVIGDKVVGMTEALVDRSLLGKKYCAVIGKKENSICKNGEIITDVVLEKLIALGVKTTTVVFEGLGEMVLINKKFST